MYREKLQGLKGNAQVCTATVGLPQILLLANRSAMDRILEVVRNTHAHSSGLPEDE